MKPITKKWHYLFRQLQNFVGYIAAMIGAAAYIEDWKDSLSASYNFMQNLRVYLLNN